MAYVAAEARQQLLDDLGRATDELGVALAALGAAYEQLDERNADRLEEELFRPVQLAYGRARRTHAGFADRHGLQGRTFETASAGLPSQGVKGFLDNAVEAVGKADSAIAEIQDSMMPVEVGDAELRAGLAEVRETVGTLRSRAREFVRTFGR
jgi:transcriptional accessory protein Tex/SPT6